MMELRWLQAELLISVTLQPSELDEAQGPNTALDVTVRVLRAERLPAMELQGGCNPLVRALSGGQVGKAASHVLND